VLAVVAPGQGAQSPGVLIPWLDHPAAAAALREAEAVTGLDLIRLGTTGTADEVRDTAVAQPLLTALALATIAALELSPADIDIAAGHSIGELPAAVLAGSLTPATALRIARERGAAMAAACAASPTGMTAVLGGDADELDVLLGKLGLVAANRNGAGQTVVAGSLDALAALAEAPPAKARLRPLAVAGAFHTSAMEPARQALASLMRELTASDPQPRLISNADGGVVTTGSELLARLVAQVAAPVRWDLCQQTMVGLGVTALLELAPGGTLTGLAKRTMPGVETFAVKTPDDLPAARGLLASRSGAAPEAAPAFRLVVAPYGGTFDASDLNEGSMLPAGAMLGSVRTSRAEHPVASPIGGVLIEWLASDGDPVAPGQPLARLSAGNGTDAHGVHDDTHEVHQHDQHVGGMA
jgi:[acyl-carrier-protein] S-malonyltransferase